MARNSLRILGKLKMRRSKKIKQASVDDFIEQEFPVECKGRDAQRNEVFRHPVLTKVKIHKSPGSSMISTDVSGCPYNAGGHGQRCEAGCYRSVDKPNKIAICAYSIDLPHSITQD